MWLFPAIGYVTGVHKTTLLRHQTACTFLAPADPVFDPRADIYTPKSERRRSWQPQWRAGTVRGEGEGRSEGDAGWGLFAGQGAGREDAAGNSDGVQQWERTAGKRGAGQGREGHSGEGEGVAMTATSVSNRALHLSPFSLPAPPPFSPQRSPDTLPNVAGGS